MNLIEVLFGVLFIIFIIGTIFYLYRFVLDYRDIVALYLIIEVIFFDFWLFSISLFLFDSLFPITDEILIVNYYLGNIALLSGLIGFTLMTNRPMFSRIARIFARLSALGYTMIVTLNLIDLLSMQPLFFVVARNNGEWELNLHPLALVIIFITVALTMLSVSLNILNSELVPDNLFSEQKRDRYLLVCTLTICLIIDIISFLGTITPNFLSLKLGFIIFVHTTIIPFILLLYFSYTYPFFFLIIGTQTSLLFEHGYIGYLVASFTDYGPSPITIFRVFKERMGLSNESIENFCVSGITALSVYDPLTERFSVFPVPIAKRLIALIFLFLIVNLDIEDERLAEGAPTFFAIMLPATVLLELNKVARIEPIIWKWLREKETLSQLADDDFLKKLTLFTLRQQFI
ncbi:MAG: hypothetical protein ACFFBD_09145 [Candidatus Hodarchaeota archaeon]